MATRAALPPLPGRLRLRPSLPFVGRSEELAALVQLWREIENDEGGRVALVGGEPGAGKTRLARELAHRTREEGALVLYGACDAAVSSPYQPFVEALEHLVAHAEPSTIEAAAGPHGGELARLLPGLARRVPGLAAPIAADPDTERHRLHTATADLVAGVARRTPVVLVLDDLHWADTSTLLLLGHLTRLAADARLLILATFREDEVERSRALVGALAELARLDGILRLRLTGLARPEIEELLRSLGAARGDETVGELARVLSDLTGGNAFLVGELSRHLVDDGGRVPAEGRLPSATVDDVGVPQSVREIVEQRVGGLAPSTRDVLDLAAVSGRAVELPTLRAAAALDDAALLPALDEATRSGMLDEIPGPPIAYRFHHELLRRAVHDRMTSLQRAALHLRTGEALERVDDTDRERIVTDLAFHFGAAAPIGGSDRAVGYALRAAGAAMRSLAFTDAARHLRDALELGIPDPRRRAEVHAELGTALHRAALAPQALESFAAAAELARDHGDAPMLTRAAIGFETACWRPGLDDRRALSLLEEASRAVGTERMPQRVRLLAHLSRALAYQGEHAAAGGRWAEAVELARSIDDRPGLAVALFHAAWTRGSRSADEVLVSVTEARDLAGELGDEELRTEAQMFRTSLLIEGYAMSEARRELDLHRTMAERAGQPFYVHVGEDMAATLAICDGRLDAAEALAERAFALAGRHDRTRSAVYGMQMFTIRREQGRLSEVSGLVRVVAAEDRQAGGVWGPALAVLLAETGELAGARRELERLSADDFAEVPHGGLWLGALAYLADACALVADANLAALLYAELRHFEGQNVLIGEAVVCYGAADRFLGNLATTMGDWSAGERHFRLALELNARLQSPTWVAHTRFGYAQLLLRRGGPGDVEHAGALLAEALATARRTEMGALARRIERLGLPVSPPTLPDGLSPREVDVLRLVARGLSNRDIGGALIISRHTAANHIRSILTKTGCANRTEAASYAHQHRLTDP